MEKILISKDKKAKFICIKCLKQWEVDVSKYYDMPKEIKLTVRCTCGYAWKAVLEKRRHHRKAVSLMGTYVYTTRGRVPYKGNLEVLDISLKGLKLRLDRPWEFNPGEFLEVEFQLDNQTKKIIKKQVVVRNCNKQMLGVAFRDTGKTDPDIGFYLL